MSGILQTFFMMGKTSDSDPATANLTFTMYLDDGGGTGLAQFDLSAAIPSAATTISIWSVVGYTADGCKTTSGQADGVDGQNDIVISAGGTTATGAGITPLTVATSPYYKRGVSIRVNGNSYTDGQTLTIGGTTVTVIISSACDIFG